MMGSSLPGSPGGHCFTSHIEQRLIGSLLFEVETTFLLYTEIENI